MLKVRTNTSLSELIVEGFISRYAERENSFQLHIRECLPWGIIARSLTIFQYYDSENIGKRKLAFRRATREPNYHGQDNDRCMRVLYNMDR